MPSALSRERRKRRLEIRLVHFTTGVMHDSAIIPVIQLDFEGKYDRSFGTHIEIMGDHLVVLFAHGSLLRSHQSLYLVDWTQGHVLYVSIFPLTVQVPLCQILMSPIAAALQRGYIFPCPDIHIKRHSSAGAET